MEITLHDKSFESFITHEDILVRIKELGEEISEAYKDKTLYLLVVLNGAYRFAADLSANIGLKAGIGFTKISSYEGMHSSGRIKLELFPEEDLSGKHVLLIEDIVDTGNTLEYVMGLPALQKAKSVKIASLLFKPEAYKKEYEIHFRGFSISNQFVVGYGLDYNGLGRNLNDIYKLK